MTISDCKQHREVWRGIPGYEGQYEVSSLGNIRSLDRITNCLMKKTGTPYQKKVKGRVKKPTVANTGYLVVNLGHNDVKLVHELVALTFLGERPAGLYICHTDGNPRNNSIENLRYDTQSENNKDKIRYGGKMRKLKAESILEIRDAAEAGATRKEIAARFGITTTMVGNIIKRRSFAWL